MGHDRRMSALAHREYDYAVEAAVQWFQLWETTGDDRHRQTALTCSRIALERFGPGESDAPERRAKQLWTVRKALEKLERGGDGT